MLDDAGDRWGMVREYSIGKPGAAAAIEVFYRTALLDDCCKCSLEGIKALDCVCIYGDGIDGSLDMDNVWKFLRTLPGHERKAVLARARSFGRGV